MLDEGLRAGEGNGQKPAEGPVWDSNGEMATEKP